MGAHTGTSGGRPRGSIHPEDSEGKAPRPADNTGRFPAALPSGHLPQRVQTTMTPLRASRQTHLEGLFWGSSDLTCPCRLLHPLPGPGITCTLSLLTTPTASHLDPRGPSQACPHPCSPCWAAFQLFPRVLIFLSTGRPQARPLARLPTAGTVLPGTCPDTRYMGTQSHTPRPSKKLDSISQQLARLALLSASRRAPHRTPSLSRMVLVLRTQPPQRPPRG